MSNVVGQIIDPNDPWALASNGYDVDRYYTRSTDGRGHSELVHTKMSPTVFGEMQGIIASGKIAAYRTMQDFIRDAVLHRAKYLSDRIKDGRLLTSAVEAEIVLAEIERAREMRKMVDQLLHESAQEVEQLIMLGKATDVYVLLEKLEHAASTLEPEDGARLMLVVRQGRDRATREWDRKRPFGSGDVS